MRKIMVLVITLALLISLVGFQFVQVLKANPILYCPEIIINHDGTITPSNSLLVRNGDTYYLTRNTTNFSFVIFCSNIVFDGQGYTIDGSTGIIGYSNKGLRLAYVTNVTLKNMAVKDFWWDNIALESCSYCTLLKVQSTGGQPLKLEASNFNKVTSSNINSLIVRGSNNTFFGNNIYHIMKPSQPNVWDNGAEGNYWSGYSGNGPYILNSNNIDNFPYNSTIDIQMPVPPIPSHTINPASTSLPTIAPTPEDTTIYDPMASPLETYLPTFSSNPPSPTATITPIPLASPSPTPEPTLEPTLTPSPSQENNQTDDFTLPIILAVIVVIAVSAAALVYLKRRKP